MHSSSKASYLLSNSPVTYLTHTNLPTKRQHSPPRTTNSLTLHLDLSSFKYFQCTNNEPHNQKQCPYFHNAQDRRRQGDFYTEQMCSFAKNNSNCPKGQFCDKSHNQVEQLYRSDRYKTKFCYFYPNELAKCEYGIFCSFAHNESEIVTPLIHNLIYDTDFYIFHYKTVFCPYNLSQHVKSLCVYAHNWQDFRRSPSFYDYEPQPCENWNPNDHITDYEKGCPMEMKCKKCHGWKEAEYHPQNYKIRKCPNEKNCRRNQDCPHWHSENEQRCIGSLAKYGFLKFVAANRIVGNTFKTIDDGGSFLSLAEQEDSTKSTTLTANKETKPKLSNEFSLGEIKEKGTFDDQMAERKNRGNSLNLKTIPLEPVLVRPKGRSVNQRNQFLATPIMERENSEKLSFDSFMNNSIKFEVTPKNVHHNDSDNENFIINKILE